MIRLGGLAVGLLALGALGSTAFHATTTQTQLTSAHNVAAAQRSDAYYACLDTQAHMLIRPHDVVYLADPNLSRWVTFTKVVGGWADLTLHRDRASVAIGLEHIRGGGTCDGDVLVSLRVRPDGRVVMGRGRQGTT